MIEYDIHTEPTARALPASPMAMPEQVLERRSGVPLWRLVFLPWLAWK